MRIIFVLLALCLASGCTSTVRSKLTAFGTIEAMPEGTVFISAANPEFAQTLEFNHYRDATAKALDAWQLRPVANEAEAEFKILLGFNVAEVNPEGDGVQTAMWLRTYPRMSFSSGVVLYDQNDKRRQYQRSVNLVLSSAAENQRLYEVTATSIGSCEVMTVVFDEMLEAIIHSFPLPSGSVQTVSVKGDSRC